MLTIPGPPWLQIGGLALGVLAVPLGLPVTADNSGQGKLAARPFAMIGVNTNNADPKELKAIIDKEQLNWRTFVVTDTIKADWNGPGAPLYYVIDAKGVIRHKWFGKPGEQAIDAAIETFVREAEGKQSNRRNDDQATGDFTVGSLS